MIVSKAVNMAKAMGVPIIGLVENMAYFKCPDCDHEHLIFGESHIHQIADEYQLSLLARLPIDPKIAVACDHGKVESIDTPWLDELLAALEGIPASSPSM